MSVWNLFLFFAVPFLIVSGIAVPLLMGEWLEKKLGLKPPPNKGE